MQGVSTINSPSRPRADALFSGNLVDVLGQRIIGGRRSAPGRENRPHSAHRASVDRYLLPGFVDAHIHIESSMLVPAQFARAASVHGTVATVSDPHEIANVLGLPGVEFMIDNAQTVPLKMFFGAPSCVPATRFETSGATLDSAAVAASAVSP